MNAHWPVWWLLSLPIYSPQYSRIVLIFCSAIILSGSMISWLWRLYFHFLESFEISKFMYTHRLMFKSGFVTALQLTIFRVSCSYLSQLLALTSAWILLITVSFVKISSWEITHFPWSWRWPYKSKFALQAPIFVIKALHKQSSWILIRLLMNNLCKNEFIKVTPTTYTCT